MEIERWDMFKEIAMMHAEVDRIFDEFFKKIPIPGGEEKISAFIPPVNMYDGGDNIVVEIALPGVKKEDMDVSLQEKTLTIAGVRLGRAGKHHYQQEWQYGGFEREILIPVPVENEGIHAEYIDGILTISIPKSNR